MKLLEKLAQVKQKREMYMKALGMCSFTRAKFWELRL